MVVMTCIWSPSAPPPIEDVSLMAHHRSPSSEGISSTLYLISLIIELNYNGTLQYFFLDLNLNAAEHFECIALYEKVVNLLILLKRCLVQCVRWKLHWIIFIFNTFHWNILNIILQSACGFNYEIQCCDSLTKWVLSQQILCW